MLYRSKDKIVSMLTNPFKTKAIGEARNGGFAQFVGIWKRLVADDALKVADLQSNQHALSYKVLSTRRLNEECFVAMCDRQIFK